MSIAAFSCVLCSLWIAADVAATPLPSAAATATAPALAEGLTIDISGLEPIDPGVRSDLLRMIRAKAEPVIARHAVPATKIKLSVAWQDVETFDYRIRLDIATHEGVQARTDDRPTGSDTEQSELGDVIEAACERALIEWTRAREEVTATSVPAPIVLDTPPPARDADRSAPRLGAMGWAGVGLVGVGVASIGAGIALLVIEPTPHPTKETTLRSWRPGGIAFTVGGGAGLVTGAVLVVLDARRSKRRSSNLAFTPSLGRGRAGGTLSVRF